MTKLWTIAAAGLMGAAVLATPTENHAMEPVRTDALSDLDALMERGIEGNVFPGAVLIIGKPGAVLWAQAYGHKTYDEDADPVTLDSVFDMASVTKAAASSAMAWALLGDGTIALDEPVSKYIEGFDEGGKDGVTIKDLMTHVSGLKSYENRNVVEQNRQEGDSPAVALVRHYAALQASYEPRTRYTYSCLNFQTMARVNEIAAGVPMDAFLKERIYGPLGMNDSVFTLSEEQLSRTMPTLRRGDGSLLVGEIHDPLANYHGVGEHCPGNAGLFSTAPDMARFMEMVLNEGRTPEGEQVLSPEILRLASMNQTPPEVDTIRGLGWVIYSTFPWATEKNQEDGQRVIGHTGYTGTLIWGDQLSGTYMVLLTNRVFPDDSSRQGLNIAGVRRQVCEIIFRSLPEYADLFEDDEEEAEAPEATAGK